MAGKGTVVINIIGNADKLKGALGDADRELGGFASKMDSTGKSLMGFGSKMTLGVTGPIVAGLGLATKAAAEDEAQQAHLATTLRNTTGATKEQVAAVEDQISKMMEVSTFADDDLRPAFENLVRETRNVEEANQLMTTAMDLAAAKGISVEEASGILVKAHNGQTRALLALGVETKNTEGTAASFSDIMKDVNKVVGGAAADALDTTAGKSAQLKVKMGEMTEQLGSALVPILDKIIPLVTTLATKFENLSPGMQTAILVIAGVAAAIGPLITVIGGLTTALAFLAANPIVLIIAAVIAIGVAIVICYQKFETFRDVVNGVFEAVVNAIGDAVGWYLQYVGQIIGGFATMAEAASKIPGIGDKFDGVAEALRNAQRDVNGWARAAHDGIDLVTNDAERAERAFRDLGLANASLGFGGGGGGYIVGGGPVRARAAGGPVSAGLPYLVGEHGPELMVPGRSGTVVPNGGGGISIVVNGAVDPPSVARQIHGILLEHQRRTGALGLT